jgi:hypothetical protein
MCLLRALNHVEILSRAENVVRGRPIILDPLPKKGHFVHGLCVDPAHTRKRKRKLSQSSPTYPRAVNIIFFPKKETENSKIAYHGESRSTCEGKSWRMTTKLKTLSWVLVVQKN